MNQRNQNHDLEQAWARAVERAVEDHHDQDKLDAELLNEAVGLRLQSGTRAGALWSATCYHGCTDSVFCP